MHVVTTCRLICVSASACLVIELRSKSECLDWLVENIALWRGEGRAMALRGKDEYCTKV